MRSGGSSAGARRPPYAIRMNSSEVMGPGPGTCQTLAERLRMPAEQDAGASRIFHEREVAQVVQLSEPADRFVSKSLMEDLAVKGVTTHGP